LAAAVTVEEKAAAQEADDSTEKGWACMRFGGKVRPEWREQERTEESRKRTERSEEQRQRIS
jgi:hypothetical protein